MGRVFLVSLGCKGHAEEKGNEGQDMGFHGGNIWIEVFMLTGILGKVHGRKSQ